MKFSRNLLVVVGLLGIGGAVFALRARPKIVAVSTPVSLLVEETIAASGRLRGQTESNVGAPNGGRVAALFVREGTYVKAHQLIARLDSEVQDAQVQQTRDALETARGQIAEVDTAVRTAEAQLQRAKRPPLSSDIERLRVENQQNSHVGEAKLLGAQQREASLYERFLELKNGARAEEVAQAETQVRQAEANLTQLERDWKRQQTLYLRNAVARVDSERAETSYLVGQQVLENARSRLQQLQSGNRPEQIAQAQADYRAAREDVASAEASLRGAQRSGAAQMASLLASPRPEDVAVEKEQLNQAIRAREVARERGREAQTALALARRRYQETLITAPFAGTITQVVTETGAVTGAGTPIARLVRTGLPEIHVDLDESNLGKLRLGQEAIVTNDAFPDTRFHARVSAIGAQVDTDRGTVEVRLVPVSPPAWVRPGQTFTVNILLGQAERQLIVPTSAVATVGGVSSLLAVENGKIVKKSVKAAPTTSRGVPILLGITPGTEVVVKQAGLQPGESVRIRSTR